MPIAPTSTSSIQPILFTPSGNALGFPSPVWPNIISNPVPWPPQGAANFGILVTINVGGLPDLISLQPGVFVWLFIQIIATNVIPSTPYSGVVMYHAKVIQHLTNGTGENVTFPWYNHQTFTLIMAASSVWYDSLGLPHQTDGAFSSTDITPSVAEPTPPQLNAPTQTNSAALI